MLLKKSCKNLILVAPYWNLNAEVTEEELKELQILVAPYWNLNCYCTFQVFYSVIILVAPYWNLNLTWEQGSFNALGNISSSILEFKYGC